MNRTQKRIIGWGLVFIGVLMEAGVGVSILDITSRTYKNGLNEMLKHPLLYFGLFLAVAGVAVLAGAGKGDKPTMKVQEGDSKGYIRLYIKKWVLSLLCLLSLIGALFAFVYQSSWPAGWVLSGVALVLLALHSKKPEPKGEGVATGQSAPLEKKVY